jgi:molybdenum-dependent DNA-binding transcriptional regulator ModE
MSTELLTRGEYSTLLAILETGYASGAAKKLDLSYQTVKNQLYTARRKAGAASTIQLVYWFGRGYLDDLLPDQDS